MVWLGFVKFGFLKNLPSLQPQSRSADTNHFYSKFVIVLKTDSHCLHDSFIRFGFKVVIFFCENEQYTFCFIEIQSYTVACYQIFRMKANINVFSFFAYFNSNSMLLIPSRAPIPGVMWRPLASPAWRRKCTWKTHSGKASDVYKELLILSWK